MTKARTISCLPFATGVVRKYSPQASPAAVMEFRYEYHDELVRLGVLPRPFAYREDPLGRRERARGFDDIEFAPDPYR